MSVVMGERGVSAVVRSAEYRELAGETLEQTLEPMLPPYSKGEHPNRSFAPKR